MEGFLPFADEEFELPDKDLSRVASEDVKSLRIKAQEQRVCHRFISYGNCNRLRCPLLHYWPDPSYVPPPIDFVSKKRYGAGRKDRPKNHNTHRANILRVWLIENFGLELLQRGEGVLDVAGGNSELSFILLNLNGIKTTLIDPRAEVNLDKYIRSHSKGYYHNRSRFSVMNSVPRAPPLLPSHLRVFFEPALWASDTTATQFRHMLARAAGVKWSVHYGLVKNEEEEAEMRRRKEEKRRRRELRLNGQGGGEGEEEDDDDDDTCCGEDDEENDEEEDDGEEENNGENEGGDTETNNNDNNNPTRAPYQWQWDEVQNILRNCTCIVGMHPDQAADPIVQFAVETETPFAVVPCCTYPKDFPNRFLNGKLVTTYEQLCDHLQNYDPRIQRTVLPFGGRNVLLYCDFGKGTPRHGPSMLLDMVPALKQMQDKADE